MSDNVLNPIEFIALLIFAVTWLSVNSTKDLEVNNKYRIYLITLVSFLCVVCSLIGLLYINKY